MSDAFCDTFLGRAAQVLHRIAVGESMPWELTWL